MILREYEHLDMVIKSSSSFILHFTHQPLSFATLHREDSSNRWYSDEANKDQRQCKLEMMYMEIEYGWDNNKKPANNS